MKIYIVNYGPHMNDALEKVKKEYQTEILTEGSVNIFATDRLRYELEQKMKNIQPDDYLLLGGNTVINSIAAIIMYEKTGIVNFFIYDAKTKEYVKRDNIMIKKEGEIYESNRKI